MDDNNKNFFLAIGLSMLILLVWQFFYAIPQMEEEKRRQAAIEKLKKNPQSTVTQAQPGGGQPTPSGTAGMQPPSAGMPANMPAPALPWQGVDRKQIVATGKRIKIENQDLTGSIALKGARLDDLVLKKYNIKLAKDSGKVALLSPSGSKDPFYSAFGWLAAAGTSAKLPNDNTLWEMESGTSLTPSSPVTVKYDNGEGLIFRNTFLVDDHYMFTVRQQVENKTGKDIQLHPYALISRHNKPDTLGFFVLHEGLVGVLGETGLKEVSYDGAVDKKVESFNAKSGWLGITDKYWANVIIPPQGARYSARFVGEAPAGRHRFQTDYMLEAIRIPAGSKTDVTSQVFAGAKKSRIVDDYATKFKIDRFDLLIDWGWFYFITKPLFNFINWIYDIVGNFGVAILVVTVFIKLLFFPLANKSYYSMAKIRQLQPEMEKIKKRHEGDNVKMQQAIMEMYRKEKVNPFSGCLPILIQIPVFFALYKVLFVTIEMRHAPFFGWIQDLSAPDPTSIFNLFGLLPFDLPIWMSIGFWPILMGVTMWVQMQLNPQQPDPIQQKIFNWMPVVFTFLLASFPAGLVIYWAWNNLLSIIQQYAIMRRHNVDIPLAENLGIEKLLGKFTSKGSRDL